MTEIRFIVPAVPVAQPRQRHTRNGHNYTPSNHPVQAFKATVRMAARQEYDGPPLDVPLSMQLVFIMPRPLKFNGKKFPNAGRFPFCNKNKDWDNLGKSVSDALNEVLYVDDGLLFDVHVQKWIAAGDEQPHVEVTIREASR